MKRRAPSPLALARVAAGLAGMAVEAWSQRRHGVVCPLCRDRTRNLTAHIWVDHTEAGPS